MSAYEIISDLSARRSGAQDKCSYVTVSAHTELFIIVHMWLDDFIAHLLYSTVCGGSL